MRPLAFISVLFCLGFGLARLMMPTVSQIHHEDIFKDMAHLFVGGLYGSAILATAFYRTQQKRIAKRSHYLLPDDINIVPTVRMSKDAMKLCWILAVSMTILEVVAFKLHQL